MFRASYGDGDRSEIDRTAGVQAEEFAADWIAPSLVFLTDDEKGGSSTIRTRQGTLWTPTRTFPQN